jgi:hypothetical protein
VVERYSKSIQRRSLGQLRRVTPVAERVNNAEAQAWGSVAKTAGNLYSQFAQYAREDAVYQSKADAEAYDFEKGPNGLTVMPPPPTEGGTIYRRNYQKVIDDIYLREIKTDVETSLSDIYAKEFLNPDQMIESMDNKINSIIQNIAPQHQQSVSRVAQNFKNSYAERSMVQHTRKMYNLHKQSLDEEYDNTFETLISLGPDASIDEINNQINKLKDISSNQANEGFIPQNVAENRLRDVESILTYYDIARIANSRSEADGTLINDIDKMATLAQLFQGYNDGEVEMLDPKTGNVVVYTAQKIRELIPDTDTRARLGQIIENRVSDLTKKNSIDQDELDYLKWQVYKANGGTERHPDFGDEKNDKYAVRLYDEKNPNFKIADMIQNLKSPDSQEAVISNAVAIKELSLYLKDDLNYIPSTIVNMLENLSLANEEDLAKFYLPLYHELTRTDKGREVWDRSKINDDVKGLYDGLKFIVGLDNKTDYSYNNRNRLAEIIPTLKEAYNKETISFLNQLIKADTTEDKYRIGINSSNISSYVRGVVDAKGIGIRGKIGADKIAVILDRATKYLNGLNKTVDGNKLNIDELDEIIIKVAESELEDMSENEHMSIDSARTLTKEEENKYLYNANTYNFYSDRIQLMYGSVNQSDIRTQAEDIQDLGNHIHKFKGLTHSGDSKNTLVTYFGNKLLQDAINNRGAIIPILTDEKNFTLIEDRVKRWESGGDMDYLDTMIITERTQEQSIPQSVIENSSIDFQGNKISSVYGVDYDIHILSNNNIAIRFLDDEGVLTGYLQDENGEIIELNVLPLIEKLNKDVLKLNEFDIKRNHYLKKNDYYLKNKDIIDEDHKWAETERYDREELEKEREKLFENSEPFDFTETDKQNLINISYFNNIPTDKNVDVLIQTPLSNSVNVAYDASEIIASALPANNHNAVKRMLFEIAFVESKWGIDKGTYQNINAPEKTNDKINEFGMWQNVEAMIHIRNELSRRNTDTKLLSNAKILEDVINERIEEYNGNFSFNNITRQDLQYPLISCAIARLYLANQDEAPISSNIKSKEGKVGRAEQWYKIYNKGNVKGGGKGSIEKYINDISSERFEKEFLELGKQRMPLLYQKSNDVYI